MALSKNKAYIANLDINKNINVIQHDGGDAQSGHKIEGTSSVIKKKPDKVRSPEKNREKCRTKKRRRSFSVEPSTSTNLDSNSEDEIKRLKSCIEQVTDEIFIYKWITEFMSHNISKLKAEYESKNFDMMNFKIFKENGRKFVKFGANGTKISHDKYKKVDWDSVTHATRSLLTIVFGRETLATHSLTGKPSPAFREKDAKAMLNPVMVNDIVEIITAKFKVSARQVRSNITTTCADENKMLKNRTVKSKTSGKYECKNESEAGTSQPNAKRINSGMYECNDESEAGPSQPNAKRMKKTNN